MNKEAKAKKHILCKKAPIVAMILAAVLAMLILSIPGLLGFSDVMDNLASSVLAVFFLIGYTRWFAPEFKGVFKTSSLATGIFFVWLPFLFKIVMSYTCWLLPWQSLRDFSRRQYSEELPSPSE